MIVTQFSKKFNFIRNISWVDVAKIGIFSLLLLKIKSEARSVIFLVGHELLWYIFNWNNLCFYVDQISCLWMKIFVIFHVSSKLNGLENKFIELANRPKEHTLRFWHWQMAEGVRRKQTEYENLKAPSSRSVCCSLLNLLLLGEFCQVYENLKPFPCNTDQ